MTKRMRLRRKKKAKAERQSRAIERTRPESTQERLERMQRVYELRRIFAEADSGSLH
jgi:hypothetical protein